MKAAMRASCLFALACLLASAVAQAPKYTKVPIDESRLAVGPAKKGQLGVVPARRPLIAFVTKPGSPQGAVFKASCAAENQSGVAVTPRTVTVRVDSGSSKLDLTYDLQTGNLRAQKTVGTAAPVRQGLGVVPQWIQAFWSGKQLTASQKTSFESTKTYLQTISRALYAASGMPGQQAGTGNAPLPSACVARTPELANMATYIYQVYAAMT